MIVKKSVNVGIGTKDPDANIHINYIGGKKIQFTNDSTTNQHIVLWEDTGYTGFGADNNSLKYYVRNNANSHVFYSGTSSELIRIQGDGNVGIGISNPQCKLDISANDKVLLNLYQGGSNNILTANNFTINNTGKLGLNVIPNARLDISENNNNTALKITQNGNYNITFPTEWKWSGGFVPNITNTNGKIDIITLIYDGVIFYASILQNF
jgi:hypothetical protein